jgi:hypothetical protein
MRGVLKGDTAAEFVVDQSGKGLAVSSDSVRMTINYVSEFIVWLQPLLFERSTPVLEEAPWRFSPRNPPSSRRPIFLNVDLDQSFNPCLLS